MNKMDYSPVLEVLKKADQDFTAKNGVTDFTQFDAALEEAAEAYNRQHGTDFDPVEARHQYLELCEQEPNPVVFEQVEISVDSLVLERRETIH